MYSLPDFNNFQPSHGKHVNGEAVVTNSLALQFPPPSSSPFLTLGSGFNEKPGLRKAPCMQDDRHNSNANKRPRPFVKDPNKYRFSCDTCNRSYLSQNELEKHFSQHVKCSFEGCSFRGHARMVELHKKLQHYTGLATKISKLNNPEEIRKWREERKRNFPTATNIKRRQEEQAEKLARGEVLGTEPFRKGKWGKGRNHNNDNESSFKKRRRRRRPRLGNKKKNFPAQSSEQTERSAKFSPQQSNCRTFDSLLRKSEVPQIQVTESKDTLLKFPGTKYIEMNDEPEVKCQASLEECNPAENVIETESVEQSIFTNAVEMTFMISDSEAEMENAHTGVSTTLQPYKNVSDVLPILSNVNSVMGKRDDQTRSAIYKAKYDDECCEEIKNNCNVAAPLSFFTADKEIEDSDNEPPTVQKIVKSEPVTSLPLHAKVGNALGSLMSAYGTDSEPETKEEPVTNSVEKQSNKKNYIKEDNSCPRPRLNSRKVNFCSEFEERSRPRQLILLQELLANEIRHERNVIFQCINYIVKNNFFDK